MYRLGQFYRTSIFVLFHIGVVMFLFHSTPNLSHLIKTPFLPLSAPIMSNPSPQSGSVVSANATTWIQSRLTPLFAATRPRQTRASGDAAAPAVDDTMAAFQDTFAQTFSPACEVRHNHVVQPLEALKQDLADRRYAAVHASAVWDLALLSTNDDGADEPTVVAGALVVTRSLPFLIRASAAQRRMQVHFSAKIEKDVNVMGDDKRRITSFYYTSVDTTPPIHLAVPRAAQQGASVG
ncbi:hypothetical protein JVU11DRAFT_1308 [Chiua virens]|nr:hypothetical protein JVU11DRAFT_1308 [Chiua virens]